MKDDKKMVFDLQQVGAGSPGDVPPKARVALLRAIQQVLLERKEEIFARARKIAKDLP